MQNTGYIHHQNSQIASLLREIVFGMEDGMVSTLGSITGIAVGSRDHYTVILAGIVIIAVESISMGIGSFLSNRSQEEVDKRKLWEEEQEIQNSLVSEKSLLKKMYQKDGWPEHLAVAMSETAAQNPQLMLKEMALRELGVLPQKKPTSAKGGVYMFFAYVMGGAIPLFAYFIFDIDKAILISIAMTLAGLMILGAGTTKYTKQPALKSGLRMLMIGGTALAAGLAAGLLVKK